MKYLLSFRERPSGGAVVPGRLLHAPGLGTVDALRVETRVALLIHGFNVDDESARQGLLALADMLPSAVDDARVAVLWPGDHWSGPLGYAFEGRDADDTALQLDRFLEDVLAPHAEVSVIAHSLGCRVAMETVKRLNAGGRSARQICLMAPAIDDDSLSGPAEYLSATRRATRVAAMSSRSDRVLKYAYPPGDAMQAFLFWSESGDLALGFHGSRPHGETGTPVPGNVLDLRIAPAQNVGHGDYVPDIPPNPRQSAAAAFADAVIAGVAAPRYE